MPAIPRVREFDSTFAIFRREGYDYIRRTCERLSTDIFETRFLLRRAVCILGEGAAKLFYDNSLFERRRSIPLRIQRTLLGRGGVHELDGHAHFRRKRMFMSLMTPESFERLERLNREHWERRVSDWVNRRKVSLFKEAREILCKTSCDWAGIPLSMRELPDRAADLGAMVDAFGAAPWKGTTGPNPLRSVAPAPDPGHPRGEAPPALRVRGPGDRLSS